MPKVYFDPNSLSGLSNAELIKNYQKIDVQVGKLKTLTVPEEIYNDMVSILGYYEAEIDKRIKEEKMYEDELDDLV